MTLSGGPDDGGFGDDEVEAAVVGLARHRCDLLHGEGDADGGDPAARRERRDGAVVMALAVAEPAAVAVEGGERNEEDRRVRPPARPAAAR